MAGLQQSRNVRLGSASWALSLGQRLAAEGGLFAAGAAGALGVHDSSSHNLYRFLHPRRLHSKCPAWPIEPPEDRGFPDRALGGMAVVLELAYATDVDREDSSGVSRHRDLPSQILFGISALATRGSEKSPIPPQSVGRLSPFHLA